MHAVVYILTYTVVDVSYFAVCGKIFVMLRLSKADILCRFR